MEELLEALFEEGLFLPILIVGIISSIVKKKNKKADKAAQARSQEPHPAAAPATPRQSHPYTPIQPTVAPTVYPSEDAGNGMTPTVHLHLTPDCDAHDIPGSLGVTSMEGKDPCHDTQLASQHTAEAPAPQAPMQSAFAWSGSSMMKAVIMQEVLTRPCQRRTRK